MAISLVGIVSAAVNGSGNTVFDLTALTGGSDSAPSPGDLVLVFSGNTAGTNVAVTCTDATYSQVGGNILVNDTYKTNAALFQKVQGATPDTSVTLTSSANSTGAAAGFAVVLRGDDQTTPLDVAVVQNSNTDTGIINATAITPVTAGAWIVLFGRTASSNATQSWTGPANMTGYQQVISAGSSRGGNSIVAFKTDWASDAFDPDPTTGGTDNVAFSFGSFLVAIRPAATGGGGQTIVGTAFADADAFHGGVVSTAYAITGAAFADPDTFHGGIVSTSYTITGATFADPDTFHGGVVTSDGGPQTIVGAAFADPDIFHGGVISTSYDIAGATFADSDIFHGGIVSQGLLIVGEPFPAATWGGGPASWGGLPADWGGDTFHGGVVSAYYAITGATFADPDTFHGGVVTIGGGGQTIVGTAFADADAFYGGAVAATYGIAGAGFLDSDIFHGGFVISGGAPRRAALASDSLTGVIVLTPANGVSILNVANGA